MFATLKTYYTETKTAVVAAVKGDTSAASSADPGKGLRGLALVGAGLGYIAAKLLR